MSIGVRVGSITSEVGAPSFFNSFFSTVKGLLEPDGAGSKFSVISNQFADGCIPANEVDQAIGALNLIRGEFAKFPPSSVIWDFDDRSKEPPWGNEISPAITSMENYFVTSTGRDLLDTLSEMFEYAKQKNSDVTIEEI
ncbi:Imm70 family immunity protein [Paraburkholderia agricolaris]|jgi:hypothetical protein|uniref:Imm70 family immunity protein n=1 Tax=Paraburkholderia agricolaris TaxID=2152888 RepID=A0ABW8ZWU7_9BURK